MSRLLGAAALSLGTCLSAGAAEAHRFHTTSAELTHRPEAARIEGSLLIAPADLARALGVEPEALEPRAIEAHLRKTFVVRTQDGPRPLELVGTEPERRGWWLHFVIRGVEALEGATLEHTVLRATEPFALHTVKIRGPRGPPRVETLDRGRATLALDARS